MAPNSSNKSPTTFGSPGALAKARKAANHDLAAGILLYRLIYRWRANKKLSRLGKSWIAMTQNQWASEAGLTLQELKNRALPRLRELPFITVRAMCLTPGGPRSTWISLDEDIYNTTIGESLSKKPPVSKSGASQVHYGAVPKKSWKAKNCGDDKAGGEIHPFASNEDVQQMGHKSDDPVEPPVQKKSILESLKDHSIGDASKVWKFPEWPEDEP